MKQFSEKPAENSRQRSFSPTTESMLKTLEAIGTFLSLFLGNQ